MDKINLVHFSPSGTTKKVGKTIAKYINENICEYDLLAKTYKNLNIENEELLIVAMPVWGGVIPNIMLNKLSEIKGKGNCICVVVYGNRDYDDALIQLYDIMSDSGFNVIASGAFLAQHSVYPIVATNRPDQSDNEKMLVFSKLVKQKLNLMQKQFDDNAELDKNNKYKLDEFYTNNKDKLYVFDKNFKTKPDIKGNRPYKKFKGLPFKPTTDSSCIRCYKCVDVCPVGAISNDKTDYEKCISCTACINICPVGARNFFGENIQKSALAFLERNKERKEPEWFI